MNFRHWRRISGIVFAALVGLGMLSACANTPQPVTGAVGGDPAAAENPFPTAPSSPRYSLRSSDVISLKVFQEPDLSVESVPISAEGNISVPLIGQVKAAGLTPVQLAQDVQQKLAAYLVHPQVTVNVLNYQSHIVTVDGGVAKPGVYKFQPGTRLSGAIAMAEGPSRVAKLSQVAIFREDAEGQSVALFNYQLVREGKQIDPVLQPNDRVVVGLSGLSQFWQDVLATLPALAIFTRI